MSEHSGESSRFMCENWISYGNSILRVNGLEGETVAHVYLTDDDKGKRESVIRLIAAAPEMYTLLARAVGIVRRYKRNHLGICEQMIEFPDNEIGSFLERIDGISRKEPKK